LGGVFTFEEDKSDDATALAARVEEETFSGGDRMETFFLPRATETDDATAFARARMSALEGEVRGDLTGDLFQDCFGCDDTGDCKTGSTSTRGPEAGAVAGRTGMAIPLVDRGESMMSRTLGPVFPDRAAVTSLEEEIDERSDRAVEAAAAAAKAGAEVFFRGQPRGCHARCGGGGVAGG